MIKKNGLTLKEGIDVRDVVRKRVLESSGIIPAVETTIEG